MSVSVRTMVLGVVDVMMRVPPLFIIDELLKISMGLPSTSLSDTHGADGDIDDNYFKLNTTSEIQAAIDEDANFYKVLSLATLKFVLCFLGKNLKFSNVKHGLKICIKPKKDTFIVRSYITYVMSNVHICTY